MSEKTNGTGVKPGFTCKNRDTSFRAVSPVEEKPNMWYVECFSTGGGFNRIKPKIIEMSEERLLQIHEEQLGREALGNMRTGGEREGYRASLRIPRGRRKVIGSRGFKWNFSRSGQPVMVPC